MARTTRERLTVVESELTRLREVHKKLTRRLEEEDTLEAASLAARAGMVREVGLVEKIQLAMAEAR